MRALWGEDVKEEGTSRVTREIEPGGDSCHLAVADQVSGGWPIILSGLKTWLVGLFKRS